MNAKCEGFRGEPCDEEWVVTYATIGKVHCNFHRMEIEKHIAELLRAIQDS